MRIEVHHHIHCDDIPGSDAAAIKTMLGKLKEILMATKAEVLDAIAAEKAEVVAALQVLQDKIDAGGAVSSADLDEIKTAVTGIHEDAPADPPADPSARRR